MTIRIAKDLSQLCFDCLEKQSEKVGLPSNCQVWKFNTVISIGKDITSREIVETMCWKVYLIWHKKINENRDKSKITKDLILPICFCQRETIFIFYKFDKFEIDFWACFKWLISFLTFLCTTIMINLDKHNNFNLRMRNSKIQWIKL